MTAAYRLRGLGWFASTVVVVLGFYLISLQVAAERKRMDDLSAAITKAHRDIRQLEIEFDTRANMTQLERWNGEILALAAPAADQIVAGEGALVQLAALTRAPDSARLRSAALVVPTVHEMPAIEGANAGTPPALVPPAGLAPPPSQPVAAQRAGSGSSRVIAQLGHSGSAVTLPPGAAPRTDRTPAQPARSRAVALLDRKLVRKTRLDELIRAIPLDAGAAR